MTSALTNMLGLQPLESINVRPTEYLAPLLLPCLPANIRSSITMPSSKQYRSHTSKKDTKLQVIYQRQPSPLPSADSKNFAAALRSNTTYLQSCLPPDSRNLYQPRRYGNHLGIPCVCEECGERPPRYVKPWNRWRWMAFHNYIRHALKIIPSVKRA